MSDLINWFHQIKEKTTHYFYGHDKLTGLLDRVQLMRDLKRMTRNQRMAVVLVDIDHFRLINDSMGHGFGDQLLKAAGHRFREPIAQGKAYRLGGDEFAAFLTLNNMQQIAAYLEALQESFKKTFFIGNCKIHVSLSMGVAFYPEDGDSLEEVLKHADMALNQAKKSGRNRYALYDKKMDEAVKDRRLIEKYLHQALENQEFEVYYQPQLMVQSGKISGFEALIRWNSPELGFVSPNRFIAIAEETQLIIPIGEWVLKKACRFIHRLHKEGHDSLDVSVNVSIVQLLQEGFVQTVLDTLKETGLNPCRLELEITETILIDSYESIRRKLELLRQHGVRIAMDDFGKGYSSLSGLNQLPINTLKIDKLFIDSLLESGPEQSIVDLIIQIGCKMGLTVLAEGVETKSQIDYLIRNQCLKAQGFFFSKPLPQRDAEALVTRTVPLVFRHEMGLRAERAV